MILKAIWILLIVDFIIGFIAAIIVKKRKIKTPWVYMNLIFIKQSMYLDENNNLKYSITFL